MEDEVGVGVGVGVVRVDEFDEREEGDDGSQGIDNGGHLDSMNWINDGQCSDALFYSENNQMKQNDEREKRSGD
jgi:hypothetical protein